MQHNVIIIGGGPAGATTGCYLSKAGIPNTIIESSNHPRPHVGESMVTATTKVFKEIGFLESMERAGFVRKHGASWHPPRGKGNVRVSFSEIKQDGVDQDYTYHVDRSKFDLMLLKHAERCGSKVVQGVHAKRVLFDNDFACGVRTSFGGNEVDLPASLIIDASGRQTLLGSQLRIKRNDPQFNQYAVHAWFKNVDRGNSPNDIHVYFLPISRGWIWQIPITSEITSVGVVAEKEAFKSVNKNPKAWFEEQCKSSPEIARAMKNAQPETEFKAEADYSYQMESFVGNGWLLVGDAARFVDPIFSSGVSVAMHSGKFASEQIVRGIACREWSRDQLMPYQERLKKGTAIWYEFIKLYYKLLPLFTLFITDDQHRHQIIQLLQGEVYDRDEVPVLQKMREFIDTVERTEGHLLQRHLDHGLNI